MLSFENKHVPISVSIGATLNREPTHLCNNGPKELIYDFRNELLVRQLALTAETRKRFLGDSLEYVNKKQAKLMLEWCNNVPVLGFNSGKVRFEFDKRALRFFAGRDKKQQD